MMERLVSNHDLVITRSAVAVEFPAVFRAAPAGGLTANQAAMRGSTGVSQLTSHALLYRDLIILQGMLSTRGSVKRQLL